MFLILSAAGHSATPPSRLNSRSSPQGRKHKDLSPPVFLPKTCTQQGTLQSNVNYSMCKTAKQKVALYCQLNGKPEPKYQHCLEGKQYKAKVYVAKTCGWMIGEMKSSVPDAEESVADLLTRKLKLY